ncbi:MAG: hypothetical protein KDA32_09155 [Phycisphaerales bacterium]|nr:hypothetical protein [Phycisphaerales bacterium]
MNANLRWANVALLMTSALAALPGCATANGRSGFTASVEPLNEAEFDDFALDIAEQLVTRMERDQLSLPVVIAPPSIERGQVTSGAARAFAQRLSEAVSDRLGGEVRFQSGAPLRSRLGFGQSRWSADRKEARFTVFDGASSQELVASVCEYAATHNPQYASLRARLHDTQDSNPAASEPVIADNRAASEAPARQATPHRRAPAVVATRTQPRRAGSSSPNPGPQLESPTIRNARLAERLARLRSDASHIDRVSAPLVSEFRPVADAVAALIKRSPDMYVEEGRGSVLYNDAESQQRVHMTTRLTPAGAPLRPTLRARGQNDARMRCRVVYFDGANRPIGATASFELSVTPYTTQRAELPVAPSGTSRFVVVVDTL